MKCCHCAAGTKTWDRQREEGVIRRDGTMHPWDTTLRRRAFCAECMRIDDSPWYCELGDAETRFLRENETPVFIPNATSSSARLE